MHSFLLMVVTLGVCIYVELSPLSWGHKEQSAWSLVRCGLLANVSAGVSVTTECLSGGKWLLYTMALWP